MYGFNWKFSINQSVNMCMTGSVWLNENQLSNRLLQYRRTQTNRLVFCISRGKCSNENNIMNLDLYDKHLVSISLVHRKKSVQN